MSSVNLAVAVALAVVNALAFLQMGEDKLRARRQQWRISEKRLLLTAACFGALGAWAGMRVFRHKTKHNAFRIGIPVMLILQLIVLILLIIKYTHT